jgi:hypothetical protein
MRFFGHFCLKTRMDIAYRLCVIEGLTVVDRKVTAQGWVLRGKFRATTACYEYCLITRAKISTPCAIFSLDTVTKLKRSVLGTTSLA